MGTYAVNRIAVDSNGAEVAVTETRGDHGTANTGEDGFLRDPNFYVEYKLADGTQLVMQEDQTLRDSSGNSYFLQPAH